MSLRLNALVAYAFALAAVVSNAGCASLGTTDLPRPWHPGPRIAVFAASAPSSAQIAASTDLGLIEVRGVGLDAHIDELLHELAEKAEALGANALVLVDTRGDFAQTLQPFIEVASGPCSYRSICMQRRLSYIQVDRPQLVLRARAMRLQGAP